MDKIRLPKALLLHFVVFAFCFVKNGYADTPLKPLWTPEDVVTFPAVITQGVSSDGRYSLIKLWQTSLVNGNAKQSSNCLLINNENLETKTINKASESCSQLQFVGEEKAFSYIFYDDNENKATLFVQDISSQKELKIQGLDEDFKSYTFSPDGKSFAFIRQEDPKQTPRIKEDDGQTIKQSLYLQKVDEKFQPVGTPQLLTPKELNLYNPLLPSSYQWSPDSQRIVIMANTPIWRSQSRIDLYMIDLKDDKIEKIDGETDYFADLKFSADGQKLAFIKSEGAGEQKIPLKSLIEQQPQTIQIFDFKTKKATSLPAVDIWHIAGWKEDNQAVIVIKQEGTKQQVYSLDIETKKLALMEVPNLPSIHNVILSQNQKIIGFAGENLHHPSEIYVSNLDSFSPKKITHFNEKNNLSAIRAEPIRWKSFDGLEIEGILTYPQGYEEGTKVPLIVSIHGGPSGVQSQTFIGNNMFGPYSPAVFASEGYATLVVNYRGSLGYGEKFQQLDYKDLGGGDFKDVMTGVDYLIDQGIADPHQLLIRGHSYGGFLAAWIIGHTDCFKAASIEAEIVDWISHIATTDAPTAMEAYFGGAYWEDYKLWREASPLSYVNNMKTPALILHGASDTRVSVTQSMQLYNALKEKGVPTRFVYYMGQEHSMTDPIATIDAMKEKLKWFKTYGGR